MGMEVLKSAATSRLRPLRCFMTSLCTPTQARAQAPAHPRRISSPGSSICASSTQHIRPASTTATSSTGSSQAPSQAHPLGPWESLLHQPTPYGQSTVSRTTQAASSAKPDPDFQKARAETAAKARIVFGSRLAGPAERKEARQRQSKLVEGVLVPPRPQEPDNCCMSGCVNCVWDVYRDDVEEWSAARREVDRRLAARTKGSQDKSVGRRPGEQPDAAAARIHAIDDDGGGSETNWSHPSDGLDDELFKDIPVGIREFMKQEKKLKEKHAREHTEAF